MQISAYVYTGISSCMLFWAIHSTWTDSKHVYLKDAYVEAQKYYAYTRDVYPVKEATVQSLCLTFQLHVEKPLPVSF